MVDCRGLHCLEFRLRLVIRLISYLSGLLHVSLFELLYELRIVTELGIVFVPSSQLLKLIILLHDQVCALSFSGCVTLPVCAHLLDRRISS